MEFDETLIERLNASTAIVKCRIVLAVADVNFYAVKPTIRQIIELYENIKDLEGVGYRITSIEYFDVVLDDWVIL